ncbi:MAG: hypothetical protein H7X95_04950, partial [Deltaproteobacteria bacterium]|nr:hypothetical protein [Deltaproteobacteria bacterium]
MPDGENPSLPFQESIVADVGGSTRRAWTHLLVAIAYLVFAAQTTGLQGVPVAVATAVLVGGLLTGSRRHFADVAMPFVAFAAVYHWLEWLRPTITSASVHVFFPYWYDKSVFGIGDVGNRISCNELFAVNHWPAVDFISGVAYLSFLPVVIAFA